MDFETLARAAKHLGFEVIRDHHWSGGRFQVRRDGSRVMFASDELSEISRFIKTMTSGARA